LYAFDHTEVEPRYEGHGLAGRLVTEALDTARERGWALLPYCPYVREFLGKHPEYADLVPGDRKAEFGLAEGKPSADVPPLVRGGQVKVGFGREWVG
jgi:GNAT superfamily N-acetyltransferase